MSWFAGTDIDDIPDNPNELPNDTYKFQVISAELKPTKDKTKTGITFKYQIVAGAWSTFFPLVDWVQVPDANVPKDKVQRMLSYLKMRLLAFGFTPDQIQEFGPGSERECINKVFYGTTSAKKDPNNESNTQIRVYKFDPIGDGVDTLVDMGDDDDVM